MGDMKLQKFEIKFDGIEPIFIITRISQDGRSTHITEYGLFFPIYRFLHKIDVWRDKRKFKKMGITPEICDMCGENIATLVIDNPNYGEVGSLFVCNGCADFCDWKMTRRPLPYRK